MSETSPRRVLVVDDDPNVIALAGAALGSERVVVEGALSGEEALSRVAARTPDLILLDVVLPDRDGLEILECLSSGGLDVPVIVITSHVGMDIAIRAMKQGAYDFLAKPLRPAQLERVVAAVLDGSGDGVEPGSGARSVEDDRERIVGRSPEIIEVYKTIGRVAPTNATVLVVGESGTGKELVARVLHRNSRRSHGPFVAVNCAAIPESLLESELFGHERGAFTGAVQRATGTVERAHRGTLFMDEIGDMSLALQSKVLRLLEQREVERVGGTGPLAVDVRVVAATNRDLQAAVRRGEFREDLYYRLAVVTISLPSLGERVGDIRLLADHWIRRLASRLGRSIERVEPEVYERLEAYGWPGNVRELRNILERSLILGRGTVLRTSDLPPLDESDSPGPAPTLEELARDGTSLEELETEYLRRILGRVGWNQTRAAELLGIHRNTVRRKIEQYGLGPSA